MKESNGCDEETEVVKVNQSPADTAVSTLTSYAENHNVFFFRRYLF